MHVQPYLFFGGNCEAASTFYQQALGAKVLMQMRFNESPDPHPPGMVPEGYDNKIMHLALQIGESVVMASDGCGDAASFSGFSLSLTVKGDAEAKQKFDALAQGGNIGMPLGPTFFAHIFGMVTDRFGMNWMVIDPIDA